MSSFSFSQSSVMEIDSWMHDEKRSPVEIDSAAIDLLDELESLGELGPVPEKNAFGLDNPEYKARSLMEAKLQMYVEYVRKKGRAPLQYEEQAEMLKRVQTFYESPGDITGIFEQENFDQWLADNDMDESWSRLAHSDKNTVATLKKRVNEVRFISKLTGKSGEEIESNLDFYKLKLGGQLGFDLEENDFLDQAQKWSQNIEDQVNLVKEFHEDSYKKIFLGEGADLAEALASIKDKPGYAKGLEAQYSKIWRDHKAKYMAEYHPYQRVADGIIRGLRRKDNIDGEGFELFESSERRDKADEEDIQTFAELMLLDDHEFQKVLQLIAIKSEVMGTPEKESLIWRMIHMGGRGMESFSRSLASQFIRAIGAATAEDLHRVQETDKRLAMIRESFINPMKYKGDFGLLDYELYLNGILDVSESLPLLMASTTPVGMVAAVSYYQRESEYTLKELGASGDEALYASIPLAVAMVAVDKFQLKIAAGKMPALSTYLTKSNPAISKIVSKLGYGLEAVTAETITELIQDQVLPDIAQNIVHTLNKDVPWVDWNTHFEGYQVKETFAAVLPLAIIGAMGSSSNQVLDLKEIEADMNNPELLKHLKIDELAIKEILNERNLERKASLIHKHWNKDVFKSDEAGENGAFTEGYRQGLVDEVGRAREIYEEAEKSGALPTILSTSEGFTIKNGEEVIGLASTKEEALEIALDHAELKGELSKARIDYYSSMLEGVEETLKSNNAQRDARTEVRLDNYVSEGQAALESDKNAERVRSQLEAMERMGGGNGSVTRIVLGQSVTEFEGRLRRTINKINGGASILTVFHEDVHGWFREALHTGRITKQETVEFLHTMDDYLSDSSVGRGVNKGRKVRFLPARSENITDTMIDEAVAEFFEADILRTRKGKRTALSSAISRNLSAIARMNGAGAKFKAFVDAVREFYELALKRSTLIKKGIRDGVINEADIDAFRAAIYGTTEQGQSEKGSSQPVAPTGVMDDSSQYSLGNPVSKLLGTEFSKVEGQNLLDRVLNFLKKRQKLVVTHPEVGEITIDRAGVKSSISKGLGRKKSAAFAALPEILEQGEIADHQKNWKGRGYDTVVLAAPVEIAGHEHLVFAVVNRKGKNKYYVHEVLPLEKQSDGSFQIPSIPKGRGSTESPDIGNVAAKYLESKRNDVSSSHPGSETGRDPLSPLSGNPENQQQSFSIANQPQFLEYTGNGKQRFQALREPGALYSRITEGAQDGRQTFKHGRGYLSGLAIPRKHGREIAGMDRVSRSIREAEGEILPTSLEGEGFESVGAGGEHTVVLEGRTFQAVKFTKAGFAGAQGMDAGAYLLRWALHNRVFKDDVAVEGVVQLDGDEEARLVISQDFIQGEDASAEEIAGFLKGKGFVEVGDAWVHPVLEVKVWDVQTPGNFLRDGKGNIHAVDELIAPANQLEIDAAREQGGFGRVSFSIADRAGEEWKSALPDRIDRAANTPPIHLTIDASTDKKLLRSEAAEKAKQVLLKGVKNEHTGIEVFANNKSFKHTKDHTGSHRRLAILGEIEQVIKGATWLVAEDLDQRKAEERLQENTNHHLAHPVTINGSPYVAWITVQKSHNGRNLYNIQDIELLETKVSPKEAEVELNKPTPLSRDDISTVIREHLKVEELLQREDVSFSIGSASQLDERADSLDVEANERYLAEETFDYNAVPSFSVDISHLNKSPSEYSYERQLTRTDKEREIERFYKTTLYRSEDLTNDLGVFESTTGTVVRFTSGGDLQAHGAVVDSTPNTIFVDKSTSLPLNWILSHEWVHVTQKDESSSYKDVVSTLSTLISKDEFTMMIRELDRMGYEGSKIPLEWVAHLMGDAVSGEIIFITNRLGNSAEVREVLKKFYLDHAPLSPDLLGDVNDSELALSFSDQTESEDVIGEQLRETFDKAYKQAKESGVVNTDDVRPLVPGYAEADILIRDSAYHSRASKLSMKVLAKMWNEDPTGEPVIVLAGGGGSGKTTASGVEFMESEFVIDTTMGGDWGVKEYQAEAATYGRAVQFIYVFTQFEKAFPRIIDRFLESVDSRLVPLDVAVRDHIGAQQNILNAPEDAVIFIFDNNGELGEQQLIDREKLKEYSYLNESLKRNEREDGAQRPSDARSSQETSASQRKEAEERLRRQGIKILDRYLEEGRIDQDIYDAFLGRYSSGDGGLDANSSSGSTGNGEIISDDPSFSIGSNNYKESADSSKEKAGKEPSKRKKKRAQREREEELRKVKRRGDRIGFIRDNYSDIPLGKHREQRNRKDELGKYIVDRHRGTKVVLDDAYFTVDESVKKGLVSMDKAIAKMMSVIPRAKDAAAHDNVYVNGTLQWEEDGRRCIQTLYKGGGCR